MKTILTLFVVLFSFGFVYSANYYTVSNGNYNAASSWLGNSRPGTWNNSGTNDTIFVRHDVTVTGNHGIGGSNLIMVIENGGTLTVTGKKSLNGSTLIVEEGGNLYSNTFGTNNPSPIFINGSLNVTGDKNINNSPLTISKNGILNVGGSFTTNNTSNSDLTIGGQMNVTGNVQSITGTWLVEETGWLDIGGDFINNNGAMDFTTNGNTTIGGDVQFHSGSFTIGESGYLSADGTTIQVGNAAVNNNGYMGFPNAVPHSGGNGPVNDYGGSWDCDGSGTGSVAFGQNMDCGAICDAGGSGNCSSNSAPSPPPPLPVKWLSISASENLGGVEVSWSTASEENNDYFVVERSLDAEYWLPIGTVEGAGNSNEVLNYAFLDNATTDVVTYYRVKQVDFDGEFEYSKIVAYVPGTSKGVSEGLYPNPNEGLFYIDLGEEEIVSLSIVNPKGEQVIFYYSVLDNLVKVTVDDSYASGFYTCVLVTESGVQQKNFIVK